MAAIAFDTLKFARRLKEAGVPEAQAEAQAELMAEAFVFNMDALVTKDYLEQCLDARFAVQDARIDQRFVAQDAHIDKKFAALEQRMDERFAAQDRRFEKQDRRFEEQDRRFADQDGRFANQDGRFNRIDQFIVEQKACNQRFEDHLRGHEQRFNHIDLTLVGISGELKLLRWMLALIVITTVIPVLQGWFTLYVLGG